MRFIVSLLAATVVLACGVQADLAHETEFSLARKVFNRNLLSAMDGRAKQTNFLVSTFGLHSALSFLLIGSRGNTFEQLWDVLGYNFTTLNKKSILNSYEETFKNVTKLRSVGLNIGNLFVVDEQQRLENQFVNQLNRNFATKVLRQNFQNQSNKATKDINDWIGSLTNGKITKLLDKPLNRNTKAVLANGLNFKASWPNRFDKRLNYVSKFHLKNGRTKNVTFMTIPAHRLKNARYSQNIGFQNVEIPLDRDGKLWFGIMLADRTGYDLGCCTPFTEYIHETLPASVQLTIPKFQIPQTGFNIKRILQVLGVRDLFQQSSSDLSFINGKRGLVVSDIVQKTNIRIDENGIDGAAAADIALQDSRQSDDETVQFVVDRPFIFTISDRLNNIDFFTGIVYDP